MSSLEWILQTAAPCPAWAKVAMIEWFGPVIFEMYGSSEGTGPAICDSHEWLAHPGTVGKASPRIEYSIIDDDGNDLPVGEVARSTVGAPTVHPNATVTPTRPRRCNWRTVTSPSAIWDGSMPTVSSTSLIGGSI